ncbi:MAG TPA: NAD-dependent epimerase/dehydratase family protein, partial [Gaiellales bacterium]
LPGIERITGERAGPLAGLQGCSADAVVDTSGYFPADVERSATLLAPTAGRYLFVSSRSVYADHSAPGANEDSPLGELPPDAPTDAITGESYGPLKAACERAAQAAFTGRTLVLRPGLIVGPHDPTGRFTYWPERIAAGGDVLAPAPPEQPIQVIDARDLAAFALDLIEREVSGTFDVVSPDGMLTLGAVIDACTEAARSDARIVWAGERFLLDQGVEPWTELPLWTPGADMAGFQRSDVSRALAAGLTPRPIADTVKDTLAWARAEQPDRGPAMTREREAELLAAWANAG